MKRLFLPLLLLLSLLVHAQSTEDTAVRRPEAVIIGKWNLYYGFNKIKPLRQSASILDSIVQLMTKKPLSIIDIDSYTDSRGGNDYNKLLSQQRTLEVIKYLEKRNIARRRISGKGFGACNMVANEFTGNCRNSPQNRALNRHTEIKIYDHQPHACIIGNNGKKVCHHRLYLDEKK